MRHPRQHDGALGASGRGGGRLLGGTDHRHLYSSPCKTQVSLEPPPCEELTTSDPLRNATRVRPPGVTVILSPHRMYGRRSMCRPSSWPLHHVGERERAMGSWAMKFR